MNIGTFQFAMLMSHTDLKIWQVFLHIPCVLRNFLLCSTLCEALRLSACIGNQLPRGFGKAMTKSKVMVAVKLVGRFI